MMLFMKTRIRAPDDPVRKLFRRFFAPDVVVLTNKLRQKGKVLQLRKPEQKTGGERRDAM